jgi:YVTN family beta-propeller protein
VDVNEGKELSRIKVGQKPYDVKASGDARLAYVTNSAASYVSVLDLQSMLELARISVGFGPRDIWLNHDETKAITANSGDNTMSIIDLKTRQEIKRVPVGMIPYGAAMTDDEKTALITNWGEGTLSFVDITAGKEVKRIPLCNLPYTAIVPPKSGYALVSCFAKQSLARVSLATRTMTGTIPVGRSPWGLGISGNGKTIAVANFYSSAISVIDPAKIGEVRPATATSALTQNAIASAVKTVPVAGRRAKNVVANQLGTRIVFSDLQNNTINVMDVGTGRIVHTIPVGKAPYGLDFVPKAQAPTAR